MENLRLNDKPAIRIAARRLRQFKRGGKTSILFDCEGDQVWFPEAYIKEEVGGTLLIEEWLYSRKVEEGSL